MVCAIHVIVCKMKYITHLIEYIIECLDLHFYLKYVIKKIFFFLLKFLPLLISVTNHQSRGLLWVTCRSTSLFLMSGIRERCGFRSNQERRSLITFKNSHSPHFANIQTITLIPQLWIYLILTNLFIHSGRKQYIWNTSKVQADNA